MRRRGFTMVELLLAIGLLSILVVALIRLLDTSLTIWGRTESQRDLDGMGGGVLALLDDDLMALEGGPRGDLLGDWQLFDVDRDGVAGSPMKRLRLVRQAPVRRRGEDADLLEVCWALLPPSGVETDQRSLGVLWRGERHLADADTLSFFDEDFFDSTHKPVAGSLSAVTGGVLWFEVWYAAQTSLLREGWTIGEDVADCATSWDAWAAGRLRPDLTWLNTPPAGSPKVAREPLVPRRVRIALELERPADLRWRARLAADLDPEATRIRIDDENKLPEEGTLILIGEEWVRLGPASRGSATVFRGQRGLARHGPPGRRPAAPRHADGARDPPGRDARGLGPVIAARERGAGFTIIEVVLAMAILLIGMTAILGLLSFGAAMTRTAALRTGAAHSIEAVMADLEEGLFPLVVAANGLEVAGEPEDIVDRPVPGHPGLVYSAVATPNPDSPPGAPLEYRVDVEISWSTRGATRSRTFTTLLLREVPFGERLRRRFVEGIEPASVEEARDRAPAEPGSRP